MTLAEGLRINRAERWLELDGFVPIDVRETDRTGYRLVRYLECIAVTPVSGKDHEALIVTSVRPSTIHAALLTLGLEPGEQTLQLCLAVRENLAHDPPLPSACITITASSKADAAAAGVFARPARG